MTARWTRPTRSTPGRRLGTYRSTVSGTIPVLLLWVPWAAVVWCLILFWPFGLLMMLPVRIGVRRGTGQYGALWALCFFSMATFGITWIIAAIMAMRDPCPAGWPGASQPRAPTERSVKVSLYSARPIYRLNLNSVFHFQCANRAGCLSVRSFHHLRTFLYDLSRLYFRFAQRTR